MTMRPLSELPVISQTAFESNPDAILERIGNGEGPFLIQELDGRKLVLIGWDDYWNLFGLLYPAGERERMEALCRKKGEL